ncbi:TFA2 [Cyberlindnera jadinii]|uniref:Transcription initiation factor IIE subunit beta n=1 Tax=Cyberlindnera jadinii (strain ATCC 18201 / CBS 1600 / BCRC 20928 / JCM 3617 / NBRC 0987 / NRRL Y-1542) TaxID=983966 RepID=A0A0H5CAJ1_CYBJN|nr:transcription initiation factor IIE, beta subunit [Cyberlindnera jadinii NRRL Y-1542]ODV76041.1 transcription initiation factor IIE, beta subunit [Cyberlindnera jadinii NRRL Y-1542]CEP20734.1 TFA2 [Cyberlindnera jadinii]
MSNLLDNLNAFKSKVKSAPVLTSRTITSPSPSRKSTTPQPLQPPVKRRLDDEDEDDENEESKKQHIDPSGTHLSTKLLLAVDYIKGKAQPVAIDALLSYLNLNEDSQRQKLVNLLTNLEKIQYDKDDQTLEYVSIHNIKTKDDLLKFLIDQTTFKGISVKELKDGWNGCIDAINELEEEGKILVLRTKKDNNPRLVWFNLGGELGSIDEEFVKSWQNVKLPERSELPGKLSALGLKPASVDPNTIKKDTTQQETKKRKQRKGKITNTHMAGILKDYSV